VFEGFVGLAERAKGLVEHAAVGLGGIVEFVLKVRPAGALRDEEAVVEIGVFTVGGLGFVDRQALSRLAPDDSLALGVEDIRAAFQEEHSKDVVLVGSGIEALLPQAIGGGVKMAFEFGKR
jgi:hypothetical protein